MPISSTGPTEYLLTQLNSRIVVHCEGTQIILYMCATVISMTLQLSDDARRNHSDVVSERVMDHGDQAY